jgi:hypothetical protein
MSATKKHNTPTPLRTCWGWRLVVVQWITGKYALGHTNIQVQKYRS